MPQRAWNCRRAGTVSVQRVSDEPSLHEYVLAFRTGSVVRVISRTGTGFTIEPRMKSQPDDGAEEAAVRISTGPHNNQKGADIIPKAASFQIEIHNPTLPNVLGKSSYLVTTSERGDCLD